MKHRNKWDKKMDIKFPPLRVLGKSVEMLLTVLSVVRMPYLLYSRNSYQPGIRKELFDDVLAIIDSRDISELKTHLREYNLTQDKEAVVYDTIRNIKDHFSSQGLTL